VPSEDSDAPNSGNQRFSLDDFRLRLDSPMFHRDPGSTEPVKRELPWERSADERATTVPALATIPRLPTFADLIREPAAAQPSATAPAVAPAETAAPDAPSASRGDLADVEDIAGDLVRAAPEHSVPYTADEVLAELAIKVSSTPPHGIAMVQPVAPSGSTAEPAVRTMPDLTPLSELTPYAEILQAAERAATPAPVAPAPAQASAAAVQAELDRLAYVPEAAEPVAPVVVPAIVVAEPAAGAMPMVSTPAMPVASVAAAQPGVAVPTLSDHEMYMPRAIPQNNVRKNYSDFASALHTPRRRKRHPVRRFFATIVMLSMLGGGLFAAKYYYFDQRWDADVKPLAADVEQARGLEFDHAVDVQNLDGSEYAARLVKSSLGISDDDVATIGGGWRALGLLSGDFDPANVGLAALGDAPAFYDPGAETIYVLRDLPKELHDFAMHRALTLALLDQEFGWWGKAQHSSPAVARGMRAIYDADALSVATGLLNDQERASIINQQSSLHTAYPVPNNAAPYAVAVASRLGVALRPYFDATPIDARATVEKGGPVTDAAALDLRRLLNGTAAAGSSESQGMLFWFHVLASRLDDNQAWQVALTWRDDAVSFISGDRSCVSAIVTVDPASFSAALDAFGRWAAAAPAESQTSVAATDPATGQMSVSACDPGTSIATNPGRVHLSLGGAPLDSEQYHSLVASFSTLPASQLACAAYGDDNVSAADERGVVDPVGGWVAPAGHPNPDPNEAGCAAAP